MGCLIWSFVCWKESRPVSIPSSLDSIVETEYVQIYTDLDDEQIIFYSNFFDEFYRYFDREYFPIQQDRKLKVLLFGNPYTYRDYSEDLYGRYSPYGSYLGPKKNTIVVNLESGLGTVTHEFVHHFMSVGKIDNYSDWINEGFPTFFEKFMGYLDAEGDLHISFGYFSNWRFPQTKNVIDNYTLDELLNTDDQSVARSFNLFLHKNGHLTDFIRSLYNEHGKADPVRMLETIYGDNLLTIEAEWKDWVKSQPIDANVELVQSSFVLSYQEWVRWRETTQDYLIWDERQELYIVHDIS